MSVKSIFNYRGNTRDLPLITEILSQQAKFPSLQSLNVFKRNMSLH